MVVDTVYNNLTFLKHLITFLINYLKRFGLVQFIDRTIATRLF